MLVIEMKSGVRASNEVVKDTFVELPFGGSALPELLVVVIEACPVFAEFCEAVLVDVV